ncbi:HAMP domain-containing sensor histidine kinase [Bdellovibrio sp. 22V]|uniref:sensor histidine kinase n=1 Tax=Bdellovibrio TaxID=958 RepID=UPI002542BD1B|nr:HAMP domain-containing sensor histidine kinase [Bdellovibrio sp. 22V]WII71442.1 HAMP domain-containing sensor histidine kinase [Bdellovibrio sp. 22V]
MHDLEFTSEDAYKKRLTYFKVIYFIGIAVCLVYVIKYNFEYKVYDYNPVIIPGWLAFAILPPLVLRLSKSYLYAAATLGAVAIFMLTYLLWTSGGGDAPGVFWLAAIPLVLGILIGLKGAVTGYVIVGAIILFFWYLKANSLGPNVIGEYGNYGREKLFNLVTFLIFSCFTTHQYIMGEERFMKRLMEKNLDIENLLRVLIHDIANTLSSMTYNLVKAKEDRENVSSLEFEKIEKAVDDINNLLAQVRHLKAVKDGKAALPLKPISLTLVLHEVYESTLGLAQQKGIKLSLDISRDRMLINGEKTILSNVVLVNLVNNAIKFSHPGDRIDLRAYTIDSEVVIEIQDYGIGIPTAILGQIFNINAQTTRVGTQGEKGTGYGMPLVREYLQMMNGTIEITSHETATSGKPRGTRVVLKLPMAQPLA